MSLRDLFRGSRLRMAWLRVEAPGTLGYSEVMSVAIEGSVQGAGASALSKRTPSRRTIESAMALLQ